MNDRELELAHATRAALRSVPTGVAVVTAVREGEARGITINAFTSVSLEPPTLLICVNRQARSYLYIAHSRRFALNVLAADQVGLARAFASSGSDKFAGVEWSLGSLGAPVIGNVLAWAQCVLELVHDAGDHEIVVGRVADLGTGEGSPLVYYRGTFVRLGDAVDLPAAAEQVAPIATDRALGPT